jgi:hypothetical protein
MHLLTPHAPAKAPSCAGVHAFSARLHAMARRWRDADGGGCQEEGIRRSERILRGIGIASRVLAPLSVGLLLALCNVQTAAAGIAAWTLVTIPIGALFRRRAAGRLPCLVLGTIRRAARFADSPRLASSYARQWQPASC